MVKQQSPRAGPTERSSSCQTLPEGIALRIALPITLLVSWFIILVLLSSILSLQVPSTHPTQLKKTAFHVGTLGKIDTTYVLLIKNANRNNTSVLALRSNQARQDHYTIITP